MEGGIDVCVGNVESLHGGILFFRSNDGTENWAQCYSAFFFGPINYMMASDDMSHSC